MQNRYAVARTLAGVLARSEWTAEGLAAACEDVLGRPRRRSQAALMGELLNALPTAYAPSPATISATLRLCHSFEAATRDLSKRERSAVIHRPEPRFVPVPAFQGLEIPRLATFGDLSGWLDLPPEQLSWFADERRLQAGTNIPDLQHYRYAFLPKRSGPPRLLEVPKPRLMAVQQRILRDILDRVPAHPSAHGFVAGRSVIGHAAHHAGEAVVICLDLKDFFASTPLKRVHGIFRSLGYPYEVARMLTSLASTATPKSVFLRFPSELRPDRFTQDLYRIPHLAQGAPTSPALANLAAYRLDCRLAGLAASLGGLYSRYADDMAFSGDADFARKRAALLAGVDTIARAEGYRINGRKTRVMFRGGAQRITGLVVNKHVNLPRTEFDRLKAILTNCRRHGPESQNREGVPDFRAHLTGRVAWVEQVNPARGRKLRMVLDGIDWSAGSQSHAE